jgi:hypothetical protein
MTKHTPAPWLQSWDCDPPTGSDASLKYDGFEVVNDEGWPIAFVPIHFVFPPVRSQMNKREMDWDEASTNLRLISSAPELLEALKDAYPYIDNDHLRARIGAAIAKAEGV